MKTPMQELIDILINERNQFIKMNPNQPIMDVGVKIFDVAISNAESMLEKEKEVIMDAYMAGESDATHKIDSALNHYNETFNYDTNYDRAPSEAPTKCKMKNP